MRMLRVSAVMLLASTSALAGCGSAPGGLAGPESTAQSAAAVNVADAAGATITFSANWTQAASQALVAGQPVQVVYDAARLAPKCGGSAATAGVSGNGGFAWAISGYYMLGGAAPTQFSMGNGSGVITPAVAGDLQLWFTCGNTSGNGGVDSNYGKNYPFQVTAAPTVDAGHPAVDAGHPAVDAGHPAVDAGHAVDSAAPTGTVQVQVVSDAVVGSAGSAPPDAIAATPLAGVSVYDGPWEAGGPLGLTDSSGNFTATLSQGAHQLSVMMMTSSHSMLASEGNAFTVTRTPGTLVIHVAPTEVQIVTSYDAGMGNALYVTGETSYLGGWTTAYKLTYEASNATWVFQKNLPLGAQFKLILAPWVSGDSIAVASPGVKWAAGNNDVVTPPYQYFESILTLSPSF